MDKLIKSAFMSKILYQRLLWKYKISDISLDDRIKLITQYTKMMNERDYNKELLKTEPISSDSFEVMKVIFISKCKDAGLVPIEASMEDIDIDYIESILESLLYAHKLFLFVTIVNPNWKIKRIKELNGVSNVFVKNGYDTILDLALIYSNTDDSNNPYLKGIGPKKYKEFQEFFVLKCDLWIIEGRR